MAAPHLKISILGMAEYGKGLGVDLFSGMNFDFDPTLKDKVVDRLCLETVDYPLIVNDFNWLQKTIAVVSATYYPSFKRWYDAFNLEYNPIENYDRNEEFTTDSSSESKINTESNGNENYSHSTNAFDRDGLINDEGSTTSNNGNSNANSNGKLNEVRKGRTHGNIGVTTSQQMLEQEFKIGYKNLVEMIVSIYKHELVIPCI